MAIRAPSELTNIMGIHHKMYYTNQTSMQANIQKQNLIISDKLTASLSVVSSVCVVVKDVKVKRH